MDIPRPVNAPGYRAHPDTGRPQETHDGPDAQDAPELNYLLNVFLNEPPRARQVVGNKIQEFLLLGLGFKDYSANSQQPQEQGKQGEQGIVGHAGSQVCGVVIPQLLEHTPGQHGHEVAAQRAVAKPSFHPANAGLYQYE